MNYILLIDEQEESLARFESIIRCAFESCTINKTNSITEAKHCLKHKQHSLVLVSTGLFYNNGNSILTHIRRNAPNSYFVVIGSSYDDDVHIFNSLKVGAHGYILKEQSDNEIIEHIQGVFEGKPPLSPVVTQKILRSFHELSHKKSNHSLSVRETDVLTLVAKGYSRKEISKLLLLSVNTVSAYIKSIYQKMDINNCSEATLEAVRIGLVSVRS